MSTHPLRQSYTIGRDFDRSTSPTSSLASSRYSSSSSFFERSRDSTSTMSSMSSNTYSIGKAASRYSYTRPGSALGNETENYGSHGYSEPGATRQYLRQLPQAPASSQPSYSSYAGGRSSFTGADSWKPRDSLDSTTGTPSPPRHLAIRPNSMVMTRSDSVRMDSPGHVRGHSVHQVPPQDLTVLGKSSTTHLRTLSRLASDEASPFDINSPAQEVVGLRGRRRLQRAGATRQQGTGSYGGGDSWGGRNWMDKQRQFLQAYEYLCHIGEAKEWIEDIIHKPIPAIVELEEALRDGVTLAEVVEALNPDRRYRIFRHPKLQFRHSDNIAIFFRYLDEVQLPDLFRFELIDLYEKKNIPKVIYCIHALSWLLFRKGIVDFRIGNLVGQLEFEHHELEAMQRGLDKLGVNMPSFGNMGADFGVEPEPEPEETEEERIERELGECEDSIVELQSLARAALVRRELGDKMNDLWDWERLVVDLQSRVRGEWAREVFNYRLQMKQFSTNLQSAIRGFLVRERFRDQFMVLDSIEGQIAELQSHIRANKVRKKMSLDKQRLEGAVKKLAAFQSQARASVVRSNFNALKMAIQQQFPEPERLQANIRGARVRREVADTLNSLDQHTDMVIKLQSLARGAMERTRQATDYDALLLEEDNVVRLQSHARRYLFAAKHKKFLEELRSNEAEIIALQSHVRALLKRSEIGSLLAELEEHEEAITELQSLAKGALVRSRFAEKKRYFQEKMKEVVKIQSFVRAKLQGQAYKSLTSGKNPPVGAVKNFVHLLNDSDFDFNEEVEFERLRKTVVQQVRQNEMLEQYIDQLDIKIALLVKNKITLDEVVRHQSNFGGHHGGVLGPAPIVSGNQFDLKALNKSSRKKLESYQQLFFTLQTQPQYLARLFRRIREQGVAEKECRKIEHLMMGLFGYAQKRREEYYLLKLIARSIREEVDSSGSVQEYIRGSFFWTKLLGNYCRSPRDRKYLRDLLGPLIRDNIIEDPDLDLESDPMQIYKAAINNEELRTGRPSRRPLDIPREHAIKDPETRELFIDHLRDLREICDQYLVALEDLLPRMPYGLRYVSRQMYESLCQHFKREQPQHHLQLVCHWLWRFYLQPALTNPESVGVIDRQLSPLQKRNLGEVAKVLGQIASGRPFGGENIYLQPLNAFVAEARERLLGITRDIISVEDAESTFDIDEFNDLYAKNKPTLYIKMADIFAIHNLVSSELPHMCPNRDDVLREIMQDLGSAKSNENEMTAAGSSDIQMFLTPKLHDIEDPDAEVKALFMETKRCVLYIIRVQTGPNLLDILVKPITPEDEQRWQALLAEDFAQGSNTRGAYSDANMIDVTAMSYYELKRTALENVMRLEQMGRISKHNLYQDILNAIALDIRTKSRRRIQRQRELEGVRLTLGNLHEKAKYLEQQRKSYDDYIEQAMMTLQNKKGKKRFLLPFTKQYNHQRELERSGRVPKFGSYKYSVRSLSERGVLVSWSGISERDWDKVNLTISCDEVGIFNIEGSRGHIQIPGASALVPIEDLLQAQFEAHQFMNLFEGNLRLNVNLLLHLLYKKFYGTQ